MLMEHAEWKGQEGKLENVFAASVRRTESIGPLAFSGEGTWKV
jgi:hypothetical protein